MFPKLFVLALICNTVQQGHAVENPTEISLQLHGFDHSWSSSEGWFFAPPETYDGAFLTNDVTDIKSCAKICSEDKSYVGGEYDVGNRQCSCYKELQCLEPCADLEDGSVQFATLPHSDFDYCPKSFCDYFAETPTDFCADPNIYVAARCEWTIKAKEWMIHPSKKFAGLYNVGYDHSWSSAKGWLVMPPFSEDKLVEKSGNNIEYCAFRCSASGMDGGRYELDTQECYCFQDLTQACLEPCAGLRNNAVEFATRPSTDFEMCEKSFCDNYSEDKEEFCSDPQMKWDPEGCAHKLGHETLMTTTPSTAPTNVTPAVIRTVVEPDSAEMAMEPTFTSTTTASASTSTTTTSTSTSTTSVSASTSSNTASTSTIRTTARKRSKQYLR